MQFAPFDSSRSLILYKVRTKEFEFSLADAVGQYGLIFYNYAKLIALEKKLD